MTQLNGKVFVMGVASNLEESDKIIRVIKTVKGVKEISNHIIIRK